MDIVILKVFKIKGGKIIENRTEDVESSRAARS